MDVLHRCRTFSIIANLNEVESFILNDPKACNLYQLYLASLHPHRKLPNHIPFFTVIVRLGEKGNCTTKSNGYFNTDMLDLYHKHINENAELLLDINAECIMQVRKKFNKSVCLASFKPAIKEVVRDLAFVYMDGFINSTIFKDYKETVLGGLTTTPKLTLREKESTHKLRKILGNKDVQVSPSLRAMLGDQPKHIKEYKLRKIFGEPVEIEKVKRSRGGSDLEDQYDSDDSLLSQPKRRNRRLHVFFGDNFEVEDILFSERIRPATPDGADAEHHEIPQQPTHVKSFRLARFFGSRPPTANTGVDEADSSEDENCLTSHSKTHRLIRFFGERMDPEKESAAVSFAEQPDNVKGCTLKKIFGESAAHALSFDSRSSTWPLGRNTKSRAKLEKFFGPFQG